MAFEAGERTEAATPRRRREARERGQVARSQELNSGLLLLATVGTLALGGAAMGHTLLETVRGGLSLPGRGDLSPETLRQLLLGAGQAVLRVALPVALVGAAGAVAANLLQVGFLVTPARLHANWARLNPMQGLQQLFSSRGGLEAAKASLKILLLVVVAYRTLRPEWDRFPLLAEMELDDLVHWQLSLGLRLALRVVGAYVVLALADYGYQRWRFERDLRMSRREVLDETRQQEPSPEIRARVRSLQQDRRVRRMMQEVPKANVVVVNPTHLAVALRYAAGMRAPRVVAKGQRLMAERIVATARAARVPVVRDVPVARALFKAVPVGAEIPAALYRAVAQILAFVYAQDPRAAGVGA